MIAAILAIASGIVAVAEAILIVGGAVAVFELLFDPKGKQKVANFVANFVGGALGIAVPLLNELEGQLAPIGSAFVNSLNATGGGLLNIFRDPAAAIALTAFTDVEDKLTSLPSNLPEDAPVAAATAIGEAFGFGIGSHGVAALYEALIPENLNVFEAIGPILEKLSGFDEVAKTVREPLYKNAFGQGLDYHYKSIFKPEFASEGDAVTWHSRRLLSEDDLKEVFKYSGLKDKYEPAFTQSAYRAVQPRAVASLVQDVVFPETQMRHLLEFAGLRDVDIDFILPLMEDNSVKNLRGQYLSALVRGAEMGTLDDATLDSHLDSLNFSDKAKNYVHLTVSIKRLEQLAELYRKSVSALYETNQLTDAQYVPALEAIGINQADAEAHFAIDSARLKGRQLLAAEKEAAREQARITSVAVQTARTGYLSGDIGDAGFAAAIAASGLPLSMVPGAIELAVAQRRARRTNAYGRLLDGPAALLLVEKVRATREQLIKKLITVGMARDALQSYEIPDANINALLAEWAAQALKVVMVP